VAGETRVAVNPRPNTDENPGTGVFNAVVIIWYSILSMPPVTVESRISTSAAFTFAENRSACKPPTTTVNIKNFLNVLIMTSPFCV